MAAAAPAVAVSPSKLKYAIEAGVRLGNSWDGYYRVTSTTISSSSSRAGAPDGFAIVNQTASGQTQPSLTTSFTITNDVVISSAIPTEWFTAAPTTSHVTVSTPLWGLTVGLAQSIPGRTGSFYVFSFTWQASGTGQTLPDRTTGVNEAWPGSEIRASISPRVLGGRITTERNFFLAQIRGGGTTGNGFAVAGSGNWNRVSVG